MAVSNEHTIKHRRTPNLKLPKYQFFHIFRIIVEVYKKLKANPVLVVLIAVILLILGIFGTIIIIIIGPYVTRPGAIAVNLVLVWLLLKVLVRALVFPGSILCWKRSTEQTFKVEIAKQFCHHLTFLLSFLKQLIKEPHDKVWTLERVAIGVTVLDNLIRNFDMQRKDEVILNKKQQLMSELAIQIQNWLKTDTTINLRGSTQSLYQYLMGKTGSMQYDELGLYSHDDATKVLPRLSGNVQLKDPKIQIAALNDLIALLKELTVKSKSNCLVRARNFMDVPAIGSLHQIRAELSYRYEGKQMWVKGKGACLDAMYLPTPHVKQSTGQYQSGGASSSSSRPKITDAPVVICCNPNAGYYETMVYQNDLLDFFLNRGISLVVFNYRGYGRSKGRPSPGAVRDDADLIASHVFSLGCRQVGIYGRSIGGVGACYVASKHPVQFVVADRTFSSLGLTAKYTFGNWAEQGLRVAGTRADNTEYFADSTVPLKIVLCDAKDAIIPDFSALRTALALKRVEQLPEKEKLEFSDAQLQRVADAHAFLDRLIKICDQSEGERESRELQFKPGNGTPEHPDDSKLRLSESNPQEAPGSWTDNTWINENKKYIAKIFTNEQLNIYRNAIDTFSIGFNAAGSTVDDALCSENNAGNPVRALKCLIANLQIWGALPNENVPVKNSEWSSSNGVHHVHLGMYLTGSHTQGPQTISQIEKKITLEDICEYYLFIAKAQILQQNQILRTIATSLNLSESMSEELNAVEILAKEAIMEFDNFIQQIARYFRKQDYGTHETYSSGIQSDSSSLEEDLRRNSHSSTSDVQTAREALGYQIHLECGHNGTFEEHESRLLAFYLNPTLQTMVKNISNPTRGANDSGIEMGIID